MYAPPVYCVQTSRAPKQVTITVLSAMMAVTKNTIIDTRPDFLTTRSIKTTPAIEATKHIPAYTEASPIPFMPSRMNWTIDIDAQNRTMNEDVAAAVCR